jgi:RNA polymerase sigma-70 factor, ECF subfamily
MGSCCWRQTSYFRAVANRPMTIVSDQALLQLVQTGHQPALMVLYHRYASLVYSTAIRLLRSPASAEDVTQDLFLRLWVHPQQVQVTGETLHGWMAIASRNRSIDLLRLKNPEQLGDLVLISPSNAGTCTEHRLMCELILGLMEADERVVIEMAYLEGMTQIEIASATGWPLGTVKTTIRRALIGVRNTLAANTESLTHSFAFIA